MSYELKPFKKQQVWERLCGIHNKNKLFVDEEFPADDSSLYFTKSPPEDIQWKRPYEAMKDPKFVIEYFDRSALNQGGIGNCWFIAACGGLFQAEKCFNMVVPDDQEYDENYGGLFHFRFWLYGEWVDVVIDDLLPFREKNGEYKLVFCSNSSYPNELWAPLLEKAYAKLYGSYEALDGGYTYDALIDMTGGIQESFDLTKLHDDKKQELWPVLFEAFNRNSIIACSMDPDPNETEAEMENGLIKGHAYTVTDIADINYNGKATKLVQCRNPWGNEAEWNGPWSDRSEEWNYVSKQVKDELGFYDEADGEFWMSFSDFIKNWGSIEMCHLSANNLTAELKATRFARKKSKNMQNIKFWECSIYQGAWKSGSNAGGSGHQNKAKFWTNPQFLVAINDIEKDEDNLVTVIIALMQKDSRLRRYETNNQEAEEYIQFKFYKVIDDSSIDENKAKHRKFYAKQLKCVGDSGQFINMREVTKRFRVEPGYYLIIPCTYDEDIDCEFMLRIFTEENVDPSLLEDEKEDLTEDDFYIEEDPMDTPINWKELNDSKKPKNIFMR